MFPYSYEANKKHWSLLHLRVVHDVSQGSVLQSSEAVDEPLHVPPSWHDLVRVRLPPLQSLEQDVHGFHDFH